MYSLKRGCIKAFAWNQILADHSGLPILHVFNRSGRAIEMMFQPDFAITGNPDLVIFQTIVEDIFDRYKSAINGIVSQEAMAVDLERSIAMEIIATYRTQIAAEQAKDLSAIGIERAKLEDLFRLS